MNRIESLREKITKLTGLLTNKKVTVTQRGVQAFVTFDKSGIPTSVNVPYIADNSTDEFVRAIEGFLDHEVAHVIFTDGSVIIKANKLGVAGFHNAVEDIYIETAMSNKFPGSKFNLTVMHDLFIRDYVDASYQKNLNKPVEQLLVALLRSYAGQTAFTDYIADKLVHLKDVDAKLRDFCTKELPRMKSSNDALDIALKIRNLLEEIKPKEEEKEEEKGESGESGEVPEEKGKSGPSSKKDKSEEPPPVGNEDDSSENVREPSNTEETASKNTESDASDSKGEKDQSESGGEGEGEDLDDEDLEDGDLEDGDLEDGDLEGEEGENPKTDYKDDKHLDLDAEQPLSINTKDLQANMRDFDEAMSELITREAINVAASSEYLIFTKDFDRVEKFDVNARGGLEKNAILTMQSKVDHMVGKIQRDLERAVSAQNKVTWENNKRSGVINNSSLSRLISFGDERVFKRKYETRAPNTAVTLLIDCSGSMRQYDKITTAAYTAYALSSTLERLKINHEILGFTTQRDINKNILKEIKKTGTRYSRFEDLYIPIFKSFGERVTVKVKENLASLAHARWLENNVDGESLNIAAQRLSKQKEERKILIVLSDGNPACSGDKVALRTHLKKTVEEISKSNIEVLGVGIMDDAVKAYYPKYVVIQKLQDLPSKVISEMRKLLTS